MVADLKSSTKLGTGKWAQSTASIYEAATGGVMSIFDEFRSDFLAIQGDGVFALFWGEKRVQRAVCAGITVKTFSEDVVERLENKWKNIAEIGTGYKVGVANSRVLVKRAGTPRNPAQQEPVWTGNAVNYATKAAQCADRGEMVVTGSVWDSVENNDYLALSCPCGDGPSESIWEDFTIDQLPEGDPDAVGRVLTATWCDVHGADYCAAVLAGEKKRDDAAGARLALTKSHMESAWWAKAQNERRSRLARLRGSPLDRAEVSGSGGPRAGAGGVQRPGPSMAGAEPGERLGAARRDENRCHAGATGVTGGVLFNLIKDRPNRSLTLDVTAAVCGALVLLAGVLAGSALLPRLRSRPWRREPPTSPLYFAHIARRYQGDLESAYPQVLSVDRDAMTREIGLQVRANAGVAYRKHRLAHAAIVSLLLALFALVAVAVGIVKHW